MHIIFVLYYLISVSNHSNPLTLQNVCSHIDHLPPPENLHINGTVNSLTWIEWNPPYSAMNSKSGIIHVDPHITQYTVHITDIYSGSVIRQNVTETQYTSNTQDDSLCPTYQVSAWNVGGEGELSKPVQDSTSRGKQAKNLLN